MKDARIGRFFKELRGKHVAVLGIGVSNTGLVRLLLEQGAEVTACDRRDKEALGEVPAHLMSLGAGLRLGADYLADLNADVVFRTPGMNFFHPELMALRHRGAVVTSEMEVFFDLCPCKTIAVTGSDGKTTTTTLIAEMLRAQGETVHLGGNIGRALLPELLHIAPTDVAVVELSSFQLISMRSSPDLAVITNVAPNHLDVHKDMAEYIGAKQNLYLHQNAFSRTVLNLDNSVTASFAPDVRGELRWFSLEQPVERGAYLDREDWLCVAGDGQSTRVIPAGDIRLPGIHNVANYLAALAALAGLSQEPCSSGNMRMGALVSHDSVRKVAKTFGGVAHRIEFVRELCGVRWYNDSIATSPTRAIAGLCSFGQKLILIAGGYDKKIPFEPLAPYVTEKVKLLILTGDTADQLEAAVTADPGYRENTPRILRAQSLEQAVGLAALHAVCGDVVSLSPACASFDRYPNFEARGNHFRALVEALEDNPPGSTTK